MAPNPDTVWSRSLGFAYRRMNLATVWIFNGPAYILVSERYLIRCGVSAAIPSRALRLASYCV